MVQRFLTHALVVTSAIGLIVAVNLRAPWPQFGGRVGIFVLYILIIGGVAWVVMPMLGRFTGNKPPLVRWSMRLSALLVTGTIGAAVATVVARFVLDAGRDQPLVHAFAQSLRSALPITLIIGVLATVMMTSRKRLEVSQLELQTQRLEKERLEKLAAEAQLASLSSRVQPHFLFNTLNSISALIREDPAQAEQTIERLASLLRSSLDMAPTVTFEQEMTLVRDYLEIQKTRLGARVQFEIAVEPGCNPEVPPFSVQTLVENCLKHVAGTRAEGVSVRVRASGAGRDVVITVSDDGPGFDPAVIRSGGGLENLQSRLRAVYGDRAALDFVREPRGMVVRLRVPAE